MNLSTSAKLTRVSDAVAAGTTAVNSASIDMTSFGAVQFIVAMGVITTGGAQSVKLQESADDSAWNDLAGTSITIDDDADSQIAVMDLITPADRYIRCVVSRATQNSVVDGIIAMQYLAKAEPVTHDAATVAGSITVLSPAEA